MELIKVLLVDDNPSDLALMHAGLGSPPFKVTLATGVTEALRRMTTDVFDVLVTDQCMPGDGDGFTVVSAMRSVQPHALTVLTSGSPNALAAMAAIARGPHEILVKSSNTSALSELIRRRVGSFKGSVRPPKEPVAEILRRQTRVIIADWLARSKQDEILGGIQLDDSDRIGHLPQLLDDVMVRLCRTQPSSSHAKISLAAAEHGVLRYSQGYSAEMIVDESRLLQVSIFHELHNGLDRIDLSTMLIDVMTIADEVDSQLKQSISSYLRHSRSAPAA